MINNTVYFIEYLSLRNWRFFLDSSGQKKDSICFVFDSPWLDFLLVKLLGKIYGVSVKKAKFRIVDVRDQTGLSVKLKILYSDLLKFQSMIELNEIYQNFLKGFWKEKRLPLFIAKSSACSYDFSGPGKYFETWHVLMLIQIASWYAKKEGSTTPAKLVINERPWLRELVSYASEYGIELLSTRAINARNLWLNFRFQRLKKLAAYLLTLRFKGIFSIFHCLVSQCYRRFTHKSLGSVSPIFSKGMKIPSACLAVEYWGHFNLDRPECYSDLFFFPKSHLKGEDITLIFNMSNDPLNDTKWKQLKNQGIKAIALSKRSSLVEKSSVPIFDFSPKISLVESTKNTNMEWECLRKLKRNYDYWKIYWKELLLRNNIKLYTGWYKFDARHMAIADALEETGGITTLYQRAYEPNSSAEAAISLDIMFGLSKISADIERWSGSDVAYYVIVGYLGDHRFNLLREKGREIRESLFKNGAKHVFAYFDENTADDSRWFIGNDLARENYTFLLEKVLENRDIGIVIKPKAPHTLMRRLGPVGKLLQSAQKTGRCYIFWEGVVQASYPPVAAALAADIAIHDCLNAGTAGMESALAGVPTLLMDKEGWHDSPLYQLGVGRVVFTAWPLLWEACHQFWAQKNGFWKIGNWSTILDELDPFRDGRAAERMGTYLEWLINGFKAGLKREIILADAAERYTKKWGHDKITCLSRKTSNRLKEGMIV